MGYIEIKCSGSGERRKKAWIEDWRPFFIQSLHKQIVGRETTMGFQQPSFKPDRRREHLNREHNDLLKQASLHLECVMGVHRPNLADSGVFDEE